MHGCFLPRHTLENVVRRNLTRSPARDVSLHCGLSKELSGGAALYSRFRVHVAHLDCVANHVLLDAREVEQYHSLLWPGGHAYGADLRRISTQGIELSNS